jgi:ribosomal protein S18 acetylase RimI-like enzyme
VAEFEMREMTSSDVDAVGNVTAAGGFGDRREFFRMAIEMPDCRPILAVSEGRPIGTGLGAIHGDVGWVGVIFVAPELRGRGIGRALTVAVCDILQGAGCRSLVLVATDLGRPVYDRLGFREQTRYHMYPADPLDSPPLPPPGTNLRPIRAADVEAIAVLDRHASGEDRRPLIDRFAASGWLLEDERDAGMGAGTGEPTLRAFLLPTYRGNAALIALRHEDAECLLDLHRHLVPQGGTAWAGLITENEAGRRLLAERGRAEWRTFPRMVRGPEPEWRPAAIWGQFNHAMG